MFDNYQVRFSLTPGRMDYLPVEAIKAPLPSHTNGASVGAASFTDLIDAYILSPEWMQLADRTGYTWAFIVEGIRNRWSSTPVALWSEQQQLKAILAWRNERAHQPRTADHHLTVLHHMLA